MIAIFYICNAIQEKNSVKFCSKQYQNKDKNIVNCGTFTCEYI